MDIDFSKIVLPQDYQNNPAAKKLYTNIPVRKPSKTEFFRVLDREEYTTRAAIIELKEEGETYLVHTDLLSDLSGYAVPVQVCVVMTRMQSLLIWPVKLPQERRNLWHDTALEASRLAKEKWICIRADMSAGCYEILEAVAKLPEPEWPIEELTFQRMVELAFKDFYVDSLDHPLIMRLTGQV